MLPMLAPDSGRGAGDTRSFLSGLLLRAALKLKDTGFRIRGKG